MLLSWGFLFVCLFFFSLQVMFIQNLVKKFTMGTGKTHQLPGGGAALSTRCFHTYQTLLKPPRKLRFLKENTLPNIYYNFFWPKDGFCSCPLLHLRHPRAPTTVAGGKAVFPWVAGAASTRLRCPSAAWCHWAAGQCWWPSQGGGTQAEHPGVLRSQGRPGDHRWWPELAPDES